MRIYDISQELLAGKLFPGMEPPQHRYLETIEKDGLCNVSELTFNVHAGTHMDAPLHFEQNGRDIASVPLNKCIGPARVATFEEDIMPKHLLSMLKDAPGHLLFRGAGKITLDAAKLLAQSGIQLVGVEHQAVGLPGQGPEIHHILLGSDMVVLEGLNLKEVPDGDYLLCAQPICVKGADGAPVRAVLLGEMYGK